MIGDRSELIAHFDQSVVGYQEAHGDARRLLDYRLGLVRRCCEGRERGAFLEVGCGTAVHLTALAPAISRVIETDIYSRDDPCRMAACASPHPHRIELRVDTAEELRTVDDDFVALYVEAIEHMLDQASVVRQVAGPAGRHLAVDRRSRGNSNHVLPHWIRGRPVDAVCAPPALSCVSAIQIRSSVCDHDLAEMAAAFEMARLRWPRRTGMSGRSQGASDAARWPGSLPRNRRGFRR